MSQSYHIDKDFNLRKVRRSASRVAGSILKWTLSTLLLAAVYYVALSFFLSTDTEKRLRSENALYKKLYAEMERKQKLLGSVVEDLHYRDNAIYEQVFHTPAPEPDPSGNIGSGIDIERETGNALVKYTDEKIDALKSDSQRIEKNFKEIFTLLTTREKGSLPPMHAPISDLKYAQIGATIGPKLSPFYKVPSQHNGLDVIAGQGEKVFSTSEGLVITAKRSGKGHGNTVEVDLCNGYTVSYSHLGDILVFKGQRVSVGTAIGTVGVSGNSFAPHLHYEIWKGEAPVDPSDYMFASVDPLQYTNVSYMAAATGQSLD